MDIVLRAVFVRLHPPADARGRSARALLARALRPHPARRHRRPRPAGRDPERLLGHRARDRGRTFALLTVGGSYLNFRFRRLRPVLEGEPIVLVEDGKVIDATCAASGSPRRSLRRRRACSSSRRSTTCLGRARDVGADQLHPEEVPPRRAAVSDGEGRRGLITPAEAVDAIEECFHRLARGAVENRAAAADARRGRSR